MRVGTQFNASIPARGTRRFFSHSWPPAWHVAWNVVPTTPRRGGPQVEWEVEVERASSSRVTYWLTIKNLTTSAANVDARYAILNS